MNILAQIRMSTKRMARVPNAAGTPTIIDDASLVGSPQLAYVAFVVAGCHQLRNVMDDTESRLPY
jgi:hypothetical protein